MVDTEVGGALADAQLAEESARCSHLATPAPTFAG